MKKIVEIFFFRRQKICGVGSLEKLKTSYVWPYGRSINNFALGTKWSRIRPDYICVEEWHPTAASVHPALSHFSFDMCTFSYNFVERTRNSC